MNMLLSCISNLRISTEKIVVSYRCNRVSAKRERGTRCDPWIFQGCCYCKFCTQTVGLPLPFPSVRAAPREGSHAVRSGKVGRTIRFLILLLQLWQHQPSHVRISLVTNGTIRWRWTSPCSFVCSQFALGVGHVQVRAPLQNRQSDQRDSASSRKRLVPQL